MEEAELSPGHVILRFSDMPQCWEGGHVLRGKPRMERHTTESSEEHPEWPEAR